MPAQRYQETVLGQNPLPMEREGTNCQISDKHYASNNTAVVPRYMFAVCRNIKLHRWNRQTDQTADYQGRYSSGDCLPLRCSVSTVEWTAEYKGPAW